MKCKCKSGDIAFIRKALNTSNIGKVVECKKLLGYYKRGDSINHNGEVWEAYDTDYQWVIQCKSGLETMFGPCKEALIMDSWLIPIRGTGLETEENKELVYAE